MSVTYPGWECHPELRAETLAVWPATAFGASFQLPHRTPLQFGKGLPPLWHWFHFLGADPVEKLGADGHAAKGGFLPPINLPRRMWARGRLTWHRPLLLGTAYEKTSEVTAITEKQGRSGPLVFVEVTHRVAEAGEGAAGAPVLTEIHDIVYRDPPSKTPQSVMAHTDPTSALPGFCDDVVVNSVQLFRYSALTFNSHRIHYDSDYTRTVEGYPGLIVHGPMIATLAMESLAAHRPGFTPGALDFKMLSPVCLTADGTAQLEFSGAEIGDDRVQLRARHNGGICFDATVTAL